MLTPSTAASTSATVAVATRLLRWCKLRYCSTRSSCIVTVKAFPAATNSASIAARNGFWHLQDARASGPSVDAKHSSQITAPPANHLDDEVSNGSAPGLRIDTYQMGKYFPRPSASRAAGRAFRSKQ